MFALAFGPALIRSLSRFATRLHVTWRPVESAPRVGAAISRAGLLFALLLGGWLAGQPGGVGRAVAASRPVARATAARTPAGYLLAAQNPDGGFGAAPGRRRSQLYSGWAALGLAAAGENPQDVQRDGHSLIDYIDAGAGRERPTRARSSARSWSSRAAACRPTSFGGRDLVARARARHRPERSSCPTRPTGPSFAVLALRAAGVAPAAGDASSWLVRQQDSDGGFNFAHARRLERRRRHGRRARGARRRRRVRGVGAPGARASRYIRRQQDRDGGFPSQPGAGSNAQSTAFAIQGLIAAGVDPASLHRARRAVAARSTWIR